MYRFIFKLLALLVAAAPVTGRFVPFVGPEPGRAQRQIPPIRLAHSATAQFRTTAGGSAVSVSLREVNPGAVVERGLCLTVAVGEAATAECGDLRLVHSLPSMRTLNKLRTPVLLYSSGTAHPHPVVAADVVLPRGSTGLRRVVGSLFINGKLRARSAWSGSHWPTSGAARIALGFDALSDATNLYRDSLLVEAFYTDSAAPNGESADLGGASGDLAIVNRAHSPFGAGWWLAGYEQLLLSRWGEPVLWVGGDGSVLPYAKKSDSVWVAPNPSRPDTLKRVGAGFMRLLPGGVRVAFDERGRDTATIDRLGHRTRFHYRADDLLGSVILPLPADVDTSARYALSYAGGQLQRVDAPGPDAGTVRSTVLHRTGTRVDSITDPDTTSVAFGYADATARVVSRTDRMGTVTDFRYDAGGKLSGSTLEMEDTGDNIVTTLRAQETTGLADTAGTGAGAVDTSLVYTFLDGPRTDVVDTTRFWLDRFGAPREIHDALGHVTTLERGDSRFTALVTRVEYPNGQVLGAVYDDHGNPLEQTDSSTYRTNPDGSRTYATTRYVWDRKWDFVTRIVPAEQDSTVIEYDSITGNRLWQQAGPDSTRVHFHYTTVGLVDQMWVEAHPGDVRRFEYDPTLNDLSAEVTPLGIRHEMGVDRIGRTISKRLRYAPPGRIVQEDTMVYDLADRVVHSETFGPATLVDQDSQRVVVDYGYDDSGRLRSVSRRSVPDTLSIGSIVSSYGYDAAGRKTSETPPGSLPISTKYDAAGNPIRVITSRGDTLMMGYGALNRLRWRVVPETKDYSLPATITNGSTVLARWTFPEPKVITEPDSSLTTPRDSVIFDYDAVGNLTRADNAAAQIRRAYYRNGLLRYDTLRIHTWADSSHGGSFSHEYVLTLQYDLNGRRIELGHPVSVAPRNGTTDQVHATQSYDYDPETGALFHVTDVLGNTFTLSYDAYGRSSRVLGPGGTEVNRGYDADGNMTSLVASSPNYRGTGTLGAIFSYTPSYNARGQVTSVEGAERPTFRYSTLGHLKRYSSGASSHGGEIDTYQTDALGHRGDVTEKGLSTATYYLSGTDRIDSTVPSPGVYDPNAPSSSNAYDAAGNVTFFLKSVSVGTSLTDPSQGTRNIEQTRNFYDAEDHLVASDRKICVLVVTAWIDSTTTATCKAPGVLDDSNANVFEWYRYDALGRRVLVRTRRDQNCSTGMCSSSITRNVWDGDDLLYEIRSPGGNVSAATLEDDHASGDNYGSVAYTHGLGIDQPLDLIRSGYLDDFGVEYDMQHWGGPFAIVPLADWRGGYRAGTMANGHSTPCGPGEGCEMLTWPAGNYMPFWDDREPVSRKNWFGSLVLASKDGSGLMYRRNRYYNPTTGQFTQQDPIGLAGGLNLYGFGNGDPVGYSDPFGLSPQMCPPVCPLPGLGPVPMPTPEMVQGLARSLGEIGDVLADAASATLNVAQDKLQVKFVTYTRANPATGQVYSGRTSGVGDPQAIVNARAAGHPSRLAGFGPAVVDRWATGAQGYAAIRGREQQLIDAAGGAISEGGTSANLIRGVSRRNPLAGYYDRAATGMFGPIP